MATDEQMRRIEMTRLRGDVVRISKQVEEVTARLRKLEADAVGRGAPRVASLGLPVRGVVTA